VREAISGGSQMMSLVLGWGVGSGISKMGVFTASALFKADGVAATGVKVVAGVGVLAPGSTLQAVDIRLVKQINAARRSVL
jgi:hypothetical protein